MPVIYFGTGTVGDGEFSSTESVESLLDRLSAQGVNHLDTAAVYPSSAPGASEAVLGSAKAAERGFIIDTKIMVSGEGPGQGSLRSDAVSESLKRSLKTLGVDRVNTLYCHFPDTKTPIEETAKALNEHLAQGRLSKIGLSNYQFDQVEEMLAVCDKHGWVKPAVFQGQYNVLCRNMEKKLLPLLRQHGMNYVAYSPLAGGFLTGNFSLGKDLTGTRYADGNWMGAMYRPMYDKPAIHAAIQMLHAVLEPRAMSLAGASLRWLVYHSALGDGDGVALGATKLEQIETNLAEIRKGPLEDAMVKAFDDTWGRVEAVAP